MGLHFPAAERRNYKDSIRRAYVTPPLRWRSGGHGNETPMRPQEAVVRIEIEIGIGIVSDPDCDPDSDFDSDLDNGESVFRLQEVDGRQRRAAASRTVASFMSYLEA